MQDSDTGSKLRFMHNFSFTWKNIFVQLLLQKLGIIIVQFVKWLNFIMFTG